MDLHIVTMINHLGHGTRLDIVSQYISRNRMMIGIWIIVIALAVLWKKRSRKLILRSFALAAGLFYLVSEIGCKTLLIQETGIRPRPYIAYSGTIEAIGKNYNDSSFPSSHMVLTVAMITVLMILFPATRPYAVLYALLMAWSRMHNGMHYPSDILAGAMLGIGCGWLGIGMAKKICSAT